MDFPFKTTSVSIQLIENNIAKKIKPIKIKISDLF